MLDLVQNSLAADAQHIVIEIDEDLEANRLELMVADDGCGMSKQQCQQVADPFFTTRSARRVGLGLSLLAAAAERTGGKMRVISQPGVGTTVEAEFVYDHIDRAPLGDMSLTLLSLVALDDECGFTYWHRRGEKEFCLRSQDLRRELGAIPLSHPQVAIWLRDYVRQLEEFLEVK